MNKVITISLGGNAYQLEEAGYDALRAYLEGAKARLAGNPDEAEILADIEQAIGAKCARYLSPKKSVVKAGEVAAILTEMGPVEGEKADADAASPSPAKPKRLYRIQEGEWLGGVATGIAAYFDIDVTLVRIAIVALTVITSGAFALAYFVAWMIIPPATTDKERAAARGAPFNAQEIIDQVRAAQKIGMEHWRDWKRTMKHQHDEHRNWKREQRREWRQPHHGPSAVGELIGLIALAFFLWLGYHHVQPVHDFLDAAWNFWEGVMSKLANS